MTKFVLLEEKEEEEEKRRERERDRAIELNCMLLVKVCVRVCV